MGGAVTFFAGNSAKGDSVNETATESSWRIESVSRAYRGGEGPGLHAKMGEEWLSRVREEFSAGGGHLDLGCGAGRMTFALSALWSPGGWSIGTDRDEGALRAARERAEKENLPGARFVRLDVENEDYARILPGGAPDLITAHLCMGAGIAQRAAAVLPPGGVFACVALHKDLYKETGQGSRFALSEAEIETMFGRLGLSPIFLRVEKETIEFGSEEEILEGYFNSGASHSFWQKEGRWQALRDFARGGGRSITVRAQAQCIARKRAA